MHRPVASSTLESMQDYYRARAAEYDEWWYRQGRYDHGALANQQWFAEAEHVYAALAAQPLTGDVLELAPGTGIWTERLLATATTVTAVDGAREMLAINAAKLHNPRVHYVEANLWTWQPPRTFDAVFFGFWLSHVPVERLYAFFDFVARSLKVGGNVFWVDGLREPSSTAHDHQLPPADNQQMTRRLNDGRSFDIVKNFYAPSELVTAAATAGLVVSVHTTPTYFLYGYGQRQAEHRME